MEAGTQKRKYRRRTEEERIAELEKRIAELKAKQMAREKMANPIFREIPKLQRQLRRFSQKAMDHGRPDIANSTWAFSTQLDRILTAETASRSSAAPESE